MNKASRTEQSLIRAAIIPLINKIGWWRMGNFNASNINFVIILNFFFWYILVRCLQYTNQHLIYIKVNNSLSMKMYALKSPRPIIICIVMCSPWRLKQHVLCNAMHINNNNNWYNKHGVQALKPESIYVPVRGLNIKICCGSDLWA